MAEGETAQQETNSGSYGKRPIWQWVIIYLIIAGILYFLIYYFLFAKKGGYSNQSANPYQNSQPTATAKTSPTAMTKQNAMMEENQMVVTLNSENGSGQSGTATLKEANGKTEVMLNLTGYKAAGPQPAHIHVGACPGVGDVKYPLTSVVNGMSTTVLDVTIAQLKKELPLAINVHKSAQAITVYTACGELK